MVTCQAPITIGYHDLIVITSALSMVYEDLRGTREGAKYEELRQRLHRLFSEHEELVEVPIHPDAQIPDCIYSPDPEDFETMCSDAGGGEE